MLGGLADKAAILVDVLIAVPYMWPDSDRLGPFKYLYHESNLPSQFSHVDLVDADVVYLGIHSVRISSLDRSGLDIRSVDS